jgi:hypothetical protein
MMRSPDAWLTEGSVLGAIRLLVSYDGERCGFVNILANAAFPEEYHREFYPECAFKLPRIFRLASSCFP